MSRRLSRLGGVEILCQQVVDEVSRSLKAERVTLALYEPHEDRLAIAATHGSARPDVKDIRTEPGAWVAGHVFHSWSPHCGSRRSSDSRRRGRRPAVSDLLICRRSLVCRRENNRCVERHRQEKRCRLRTARGRGIEKVRRVGRSGRYGGPRPYRSPSSCLCSHGRFADGTLQSPLSGLASARGSGGEPNALPVR